MRVLVTPLLAILLALGVGCSSASEEPAPAATEGAEAAPPPPPEPAPAPPPPAAEAAPPSPAEPPAAAAPVEPQMPPFAAVVIHDVKDYDTFKTAFDSHVDMRKGASMIGEGLMRGLKNDKTVVVYCPATDVAKLKEFVASKDLKDKMKEAGVKGKPTIYLLKDLAGKVAPQAADIVAALLKYDTKDYAAFKTAVEAQNDARTAAGIVGYGIAQGVDKDTDAVLYLQSNDAAKLEAYLAAKETKAAMKAAGAKGQPKTTLVKEVGNKMY